MVSESDIYDVSTYVVRSHDICHTIAWHMSYDCMTYVMTHMKGYSCMVLYRFLHHNKYILAMIYNAFGNLHAP